MSTNFILQLWNATSNNDLATIKQMVSDEQYSNDIAMSAVGIALSRKHYEIAYHMLAQQGALDLYFDHPYKVDTGIKNAVNDYITKNPQGG